MTQRTQVKISPSPRAKNTSAWFWWFYSTWWFQALQGFRVAQSLQVVNQVTHGAASLSHQPQQHAARAALHLQHLQRALVHVVRAGQQGRKHIIHKALFCALDAF